MTPEVRRTPQGHYGVYIDDQLVSSPRLSREGAETVLHNLELRAARRRARQRPCLCCRRPFASEGAHNRLCGECRRLGEAGLALLGWRDQGPARGRM